MTPRSPIFGLRFQSNEAILPGAHDLSAFLESPKKEGGRERHADDLAAYAETLQVVEDYERDRRQGAGSARFSEKMLYGVLAHSECFKPALKSAVELYKYHCHALAALDLRKPTAFIRSAEEEIGRLNPKKKDDAAKISRLQAMADDRKKDLEALKARWLALAAELTSIAAWVRDNLVLIQKLCESSITVLVGLQVGRKEEARLIEDLKTHFKDQVRDSLQQGPVTKEYIENLKETVPRLSKQLSLLLLEDVYSLTSLYEAMHDHAGKAAAALDALIKEAAVKKHASIDTDRDLSARIELVLIALLAGCRFTVKARDAVRGGDPEHEGLLLQKRKEMLDRLFGLLTKEPAR